MLCTSSPSELADDGDEADDVGFILGSIFHRRHIIPVHRKLALLVSNLVAAGVIAKGSKSIRNLETIGR